MSYAGVTCKRFVCVIKRLKYIKLPKASSFYLLSFSFLIKCNQAFKLLCISTSDIYLNFSLNPNSLVTCIIPDAFISSRYIRIILIRLIIPDVHQQRFLCIQSDQVQAYVLVRPGSHWSTHQEAFVILVNAFMFIVDQADVRIREKF